MRILITGAGGQLGQALCRPGASAVEIIGLPRAELDLAHTASITDALARHRPDAVISAAAYTAVDQAESEPEAAFAINRDGAAALARACAEAGARFLHVSTDFVFDGARNTPYPPDAATAPLSVYGLSKRDGELAVRNAHPQATIVRTAWVYGPGGSNFVATMQRLITEREQLRVVTDQIGSPTHTHSLAEVLLKLAGLPEAEGETLHWTDAGIASWYDFAMAVRDNLHARQERHGQDGAETGAPPRLAVIHPIPTSDYPTPAARPHYSVLDTRATQAITGIAPRHWRHRLAEHLAASPRP